MPHYVILSHGHYVLEDNDRQRLAEPGEIIELSQEAARPLLGWRLAPYEPGETQSANEDAVAVVGPQNDDLPQVNATDSARNLAIEYGLNIRTIQGTGAGGKVTKPDVQAVIDGNA
jgi:pyruvate/2-oxoglutarate dehydrogenase complex dihydrolipoamide acyltransferase (E2) component